MVCSHHSNDLIKELNCDVSSERHKVSLSGNKCIRLRQRGRVLLPSKLMLALWPLTDTIYDACVELLELLGCDAIKSPQLDSHFDIYDHRLAFLGRRPF